MLKVKGRPAAESFWGPSILHLWAPPQGPYALCILCVWGAAALVKEFMFVVIFQCPLRAGTMMRTDTTSNPGLNLIIL